MTPAEDRDVFATTMGDFLASWNLPRATGRVYGRLLLNSSPASLDELGEALGLSKGAVSVAVRELVSWGLARTIPQPGSRRLLVEAVGGFEQLLAASHERTRAFIRVLRSGTRSAEDEKAEARLAEVADFFESYVDAGEQMLRTRRS
ncbi:transcriptional regulator [Amycolatopsis thailandensis]|uniref:Transcriptional regulator n=1 Tax=Amycolatopsis thailandensis TaxID=589330 RepID=A0A229RJI3_9PSEU|nr:MarR family transcriptional regulator [Amycolatopsis thailandensis]OXM46619.1 transcriptional regulator [Amycolatopsis thailandensis]